MIDVVNPNATIAILLLDRGLGNSDFSLLGTSASDKQNSPNNEHDPTFYTILENGGERL
ncbi:hypothetical protein J27TS7_52490 [Paenibacillus dendritiformis]|nr:hypothetical protein [Paenibacillus dendritiformis]NRG00992.1 hypothetical protein [Paenibacillus dendritiformis]GIO75735.1 hypothetical protein J27TS7_52490 [Paenibacillus dendritiformis]